MTFLELIPTARFISFTHFVSCLTTGPLPLLKPVLHKVRSRASSFNFQYSLLPVRSSSSFLRLLPRLPIISIFHSIFSSTTCCTQQFLRKMSPIQSIFIRFIVARMLLSSLTIWFFTRSVQLILPILIQHHILEYLQLLLTHFSKCQNYGIIWSYVPDVASY